MDRTGFVGQRHNIHDSLVVVYFVASFCFRLVPSCRSSFALCLFKSSVHEWLGFYVQNQP